MIDGLFIVIEGIDGAGTTTQVRRLASALGSRGLPVHVTREPSDGPVGVMIRQILAGRIVVPGLHGARAPSWDTMALLFAADRLDHLESEVVPNLADGVTVLADRYDHSSLAYQSILAGGGDAVVDWVKTINGRARRPDLVVVLDVSAEVAAKRRDARSGIRDLYEEDELQTKLVGLYREMERYFPNDRIVHVDGDRDEDAVARDVMHQVRVLRGEPTES
jgi:dTMP kinase